MFKDLGIMQIFTEGSECAFANQCSRFLHTLHCYLLKKGR